MRQCLTVRRGVIGGGSVHTPGFRLPRLPLSSPVRAYPRCGRFHAACAARSDRGPTVHLATSHTREGCDIPACAGGREAPRPVPLLASPGNNEDSSLCGRHCQCFFLLQFGNETRWHLQIWVNWLTRSLQNPAIGPHLASKGLKLLSGTRTLPSSRSSVYGVFAGHRPFCACKYPLAAKTPHTRGARR